jgi:hypothetical protein
MRNPRIAATLLATLALAGPCAAQSGVTLYGGYRGGGSFDTDTQPAQSLQLQSGAAGSISLDWAIDTMRQVQLFASYQSTDIAASASTPLVPLNVSYLHLGGTNYFEGGIGRGAYVVGGIGATRLAPGLSGLSAEYFPSMNLGLGYQWPLAGALSLRMELRGYFTLINSRSSLFCSGGCVVVIKGDSLAQAEALLGLSFAF